MNRALFRNALTINQNISVIENHLNINGIAFRPFPPPYHIYTGTLVCIIREKKRWRHMVASKKEEKKMRERPLAVSCATWTSSIKKGFRNH